MKLLIVLPPREYLQECFSYNEETGILTWKERPRSHFKYDKTWLRFKTLNAGKPAGIELYRDKTRTRNLCMRVKLHYNGVKLFPSVHRIICALKGVEVPDGCVPDHKDGNPFNNRWDNLRIGTSSQNCCNKTRSRNKRSGLPKGVSTDKNGYRVQCMVKGEPIVLRGFKTVESAHDAYKKLADEMHGEFKKID